MFVNFKLSMHENLLNLIPLVSDPAGLVWSSRIHMSDKLVLLVLGTKFENHFSILSSLF
jgi:hypothetical protein